MDASGLNQKSEPQGKFMLVECAGPGPDPASMLFAFLHGSSGCIRLARNPGGVMDKAKAIVEGLGAMRVARTHRRDDP